MRFAIIACLAGCTPSIVPGSYLCGPEQLCPEELACNGVDNTCVAPRNVQPFACEPNAVDPMTDDSPSTGTVVPGLLCISGVQVVTGCLRDSDPADWFQFDTPTECSAVGITASVTFPIAYQPIALQIAKGAEPPQLSAIECPSSTTLVEGIGAYCLETTLELGTRYALGIVHDDAAGGDCDGTCRSNRYQLRFQLETP